MNSTELADNEGHLNVLMTFSPSGPFHSPLQVNWHVCCVCTAELVSGPVASVQVVLHRISMLPTLPGTDPLHACCTV